MINVVNCTHHYGIRPVLKDINLQINTGELVALMGPNGMGKSTLMAIMAGIIAPRKGYVEFDARRRRRTIEEEREIRKMCVYLPADAWLPLTRNGREWLVAVGRLYGHDDEKLIEHAQRLIELFELSNVADSRMSSYSAGQKKKISISAALISEAPVMLLDEPFAGGLDPSGILALKRVLLRLREQRKTTIAMATPVPELVEELADRVALLRDGSLAGFDTIENLRQAAGCSGKLDEIYERLVSPDNVDSIERYLDGKRT